MNKTIKKQKFVIKKQTKQKSVKNKTKKQKKTKSGGGGGGGVIQKIVHQIWFGSKVPPWRKYLFDHNKKVCKKNGYAYRLWVEKDRLGATGRKNFPSTIDYQSTALKYGNSRWAQVADLARLEIIYLHGGIYLDSLFEISDLFLKTFTEISEKGGYTFIGANEDPCKLECVGYKGMPYLTNSFFAAAQGSSILERLLDDDALSSIDLASEYVNRTTGPYYLRKGLVDEEEEEVFLFETEQIYPFNVNASEYREIHPNTCLNTTPFQKSVSIPLKDTEGNSTNIYLDKKCLPNLQKAFIEEKKKLATKEKGPKKIGTKKIGKKEIGTKKLREEFIQKEQGPLVVYHSGLGGTWSF